MSVFSTVQSRVAAIGALTLVHLSVFGCASPDPETSFEAFADRVVARDDVGEDTGDVGVDTVDDTTPEDTTPDGSGCELPPLDPAGTFLLAVWVKAFPTKPPLLLELTVTPTDSTYTFSFQPLTNDFDVEGEVNPTPRLPAGEPVVVTGVAVTDGDFTLTVEDVIISGEANPITGREIEADIILTGGFEHGNFACGGVDGAATRPTPVALRNSTFGMERTDDVTTVTPVAINCDAEVAEPVCEGSGS